MPRFSPRHSGDGFFLGPYRDDNSFLVIGKRHGQECSLPTTLTNINYLRCMWHPFPLFAKDAKNGAPFLCRRKTENAQPAVNHDYGVISNTTPQPPPLPQVKAPLFRVVP